MAQQYFSRWFRFSGASIKKYLVSRVTGKTGEKVRVFTSESNNTITYVKKFCSNEQF